MTSILSESSRTMKIVAVLHLLVLATLMSEVSSSPRIKYKHEEQRQDTRQSRQAVTTIMFSECFSLHNAQTKYLWSRTKPYVVQGFFEDNVKIKMDSYTLYWYVINYDTREVMTTDPPYDRKDGTCIIEPYTLPAGTYEFFLNSTQIIGGNEYSTDFEGDTKCYLAMNQEKPVAIITGGSGQTFPSGTQIVFDGSQSIDMSVHQDAPSTLSYEWSCQQTDSTTEFCTGVVGTESLLAIDAMYMEPDVKIEMTLTVTSSDGASSSTTQTVQVVANAALISIRCEKNCPPVSAATVPTIGTILYAGCDEFCGGIEDEHYQWKILINKKPPEEMAQFATTGPKLIIDANKLTPNEYLARVTLKDPYKGEATQVLKVVSPPKGISCSTEPSSGKALQTIFGLKCQFPPETNYFFEVYEALSKNKRELYAGSYSQALNEMHFRLPADKKFLVKVSDVLQGTSALIPLTVDVKSLMADANSAEKVQDIVKQQLDGDDKRDSIEKMLKDDRKGEALQTIQHIISDVVNVKVKNGEMDSVFDELKERVIKDMLNTKLTSLSDLLHTSEPIAKLLSFKDKPKTDPDLAKLSTTICKKMAATHLELVKKERYPLAMGDTVNSISWGLTKCIESNSNPNPEILQPTFVLSDTTAHPLLTIEAPNEDYKDYDNFDDAYHKHIGDLEESMDNTISTTATTAKVSALTTAVGEKFVEISHEDLNTVVAKDKGAFLAKQKIKSHEVTLIPSQDFARKKHPFDILLTTWKKDLLWWNPAGLKSVTNLIYVEFWHSTCKKRISHFSLPVHIYFTITAELKSGSIVNDNMPVPPDVATISDSDLDEFMYVRRVSLGEHQGIQVKFLDVSDSKKFNVVTTIFKFPNHEDFEQSEIVDSKKNYITILNPHAYNVWAYVAIFPTKDTTSTDSVNFQMDFNMNTCIKWISDNKSWEPTCTLGLGTVGKTIHCLCHEFSMLAGYSEDIDSLPQKVEKIQIELELQVFWIIFSWVAVLFVIYCLLLILASKKCKKSVYFLGDNYRMDRWCYVIVVKTSGTLKSGTTSNVMIRLTGRHQTPAYVLNYPDPDKRMLQRNSEDWYVLCTDRHLKKIDTIELWLDGIGFQTSWYCEDVSIYDIQSEDQWYFHVNQKLGLSPELTYVTVKVFDQKQKQDQKQPKRRLCKDIVFCDGTNSWSFSRCSSQENFPYITRITVLFSTIMLASALALIMYNVPSFTESDCLDYYGHYEVTGWFFLILFSSSMLSFGIHGYIRYIFVHRSSESRFNIDRIAWILLLTLIIASITILIVFGFWTPLYTSLLWLTVCAVNIVLMAVAYEHAFIGIRNYWFARPIIFQRDIRKYAGQIMANIQKQRVILFRNLGDYMLRPYFQHLYSPLTPEQTEERRQRMLTRLNVVEQFKDLVMFGTYVVILYIVILSDKDSHTVISRQEMVDMMEGIHTRTMAFSDIQTFDHLYTYINETFIPALQNIHWYGTFSASLPGIMVDFTTKYLGVARLRQQRVYGVNCNPVGFEKSENVTRCIPEYSKLMSDDRKYGYRWKLPRLLHELDRLRLIWTHHSAYNTGVVSGHGEVASYSGDGYLGFLGRTKFNSRANLDHYKKKSWIDVGSRSVFIEFLTYNANYNMFSAVKLLFEQSVTGYTHTTIFVEPARMLHVQNEYQRLTTVIFLLFVVWVAILCLERSKWLVAKIRSFYKDAWFIVDLIILLGSIICIVLFIIRVHMIGNYLAELEKSKNNVFINYFYLFRLDSLLTMFGAFLVCVATIRLWKLLRFGAVFRLMEKTLLIAIRTLRCFLVIHVVIFMAFVFTAFILFHEKAKAFSSVDATVTTLMIYAMCFPREEKSTVYEINPSFFAIFLVVTFIIRIVYVIVIIQSFTTALKECSEIPPSYNLKHYMIEKMKCLPKYLQSKWRRLRGGYSKDLVWPKNDLIYYDQSKVILSTKIAMMRVITMGVLKNASKNKSKTELGHNKVEAMLKMAGPLLAKGCGAGRQEVFFKSNMAGVETKLVDVKRLEQIRFVVDSILKRKE